MVTFGGQKIRKSDKSIFLKPQAIAKTGTFFWLNCLCQESTKETTRNLEDTAFVAEYDALEYRDCLHINTNSELSGGGLIRKSLFSFTIEFKPLD